MREEVVADEEAHKHEVVDQALEVETVGDGDSFEMEEDLLAGELELHELEVHVYGLEHLLLHLGGLGAGHEEVAGFVADCAALLVGWHDGLPDYEELGLVGHQAEHNQIGVGTIQTVRHICQIVLTSSLLSDELHNFVLPFSWTVGIREHHYQILPERMIIHPLMHIIVQRQ